MFGRRVKTHNLGKLNPLHHTATACFLSLPLASLLWSVVSFTISLAAFCIQENPHRGPGRLLLIVVLAVLATSACAMLLFFWQMWTRPLHREIEEDYHYDQTLNDPLPTTWRNHVENQLEKLETQFRKLRLRTKGVSKNPEAGMSN